MNEQAKMADSDLATTMEDVADELDLTMGRPPDVDEPTKMDHNGRTITSLPTSIIQQFQHDINKITDLSHRTWLPGFQFNSDEATTF